VLSTERDGAALVEGALALLQPRGQLLYISHHRKMTQAGLAELVARACQARGMRVRVDPLVGAWDCPTVPGVSATKSVLARCQ
jgi:23S rRNA G2069 N7-methylase RlmK/C1962 C5-methylase RlmI